MFKKIFKSMIIASSLMFLASCSTTNSQVNNDNLILIEIKFADFGLVEAELYPEVAPVTVTNFVKLVNEGFYDGLTIHRIIKGFVIQGGDPNGDGTGGSKDTIIGEFLNNGFDNPLLHEPGVLSMARSSRFNSASSQFFIVHEEASSLNNSYAAFGKVIKGFEIIDTIANVETGERDRPLEAVVIEFIRVKKQS
jgi:peptidyl-prolyl cis-trans isomerase B (cyclophilin B)